MAVRSGLDGQLMVGKESTYGTRVAPTRGYEFSSESLELDIARVEAFGVRAQAAGAGSVQRTDRWVAGRKAVSGSIEFDGDTSGIGSKGFGMLLENAMGANAVITTPGGGTLTRDLDFDLGDPFGKSLTIQVGTPDTGGTVRVREFEGCKIVSFELAQELDKWLAGSFEIEGEDMTTSQTLASFSLPTGQELYHWGQAVYTIGGGGLDVIGYKLKVSTPMAVERYRQSSTSPALRREPIINGPRMIEGELEIEFSGLTEYNRYLNGTVAAVVATWTGSLIEGALNNQLIVTCNDVRFEKPSGPNVQGPDLVTFTAPFKALYDGTDQPLHIQYRTTDTAV